MHATNEFLVNLAMVLGVAALTTIVFQRLRQPVVLGYIIAGLIIGPHVPVPLVADPEMVELLSELGVILLMFSIGLEFRLSRVLEVGPRAGLVALVQVSSLAGLGYASARLAGWTVVEGLYTAGILAISSTTIIARVFEEQRVRGAVTDIVFGVLLVQDLVAVLLLTSFTTFSTGAGFSLGLVGRTAGGLVLFLVLLVVGGLLTIPRLVRLVVRLDRPETLLVTSVGLCFGFALLAARSGYSVALGAFIAGSLVAESGEERRVEVLVRPVRDLFAAIFFVAVGMMIEPAFVARNWGMTLWLAFVVVAGNVIAVTVGAFLTGAGIRTSIQSGMALAQIGEFSFIIASLGVTLGAVRPSLYAIAVAVSAITVTLTPTLVRTSGRVAAYIDARLPRRAQTFAALYASWLEQLRSSSRPEAARNPIRRTVHIVLLDTLLLVGVAIGTAVAARRLAPSIAARGEISPVFAVTATVVAGFALAIPFVGGLLGSLRRLGLLLADLVFPPRPERGPDLADAPRRAFVVTLQLASALVIGVPLLAALQPFLPTIPLLAVFVLVLAVVAVALWRRAAELQGHVRAGSEAILEVLAAQSRAPRAATDHHLLDRVAAILPGLGELTPIRVEPESPARGRTLAEVNLRGLTGATVLAIQRENGGVVTPSGRERLDAGDVLAVTGSHEALAAARALLEPPPSRDIAEM